MHYIHTSSGVIASRAPPAPPPGPPRGPPPPPEFAIVTEGCVTHQSHLTCTAGSRCTHQHISMNPIKLHLTTGTHTRTTPPLLNAAYPVPRLNLLRYPDVHVRLFSNEAPLAAAFIRAVMNTSSSSSAAAAAACEGCRREDLLSSSYRSCYIHMMRGCCIYIIFRASGPNQSSHQSSPYIHTVITSSHFFTASSHSGKMLGPTHYSQSALKDLHS